ncbi:hypothetical protein PhCBS80983_g05849 [Powellomyces hirtus]|uniref:Uncharacterized protein n=1 Tax=Powellomyces hirtus TaxID=109895 RepID=A0A507DSG1_9FUNG|nr:hypothetical protein PhCBS80983_g05849 [Powellomyces hirtus]
MPKAEPKRDEMPKAKQQEKPKAMPAPKQKEAHPMPAPQKQAPKATPTPTATPALVATSNAVPKRGGAKKQQPAQKNNRPAQKNNQPAQKQKQQQPAQKQGGNQQGGAQKQGGNQQGGAQNGGAQKQGGNQQGGAQNGGAQKQGGNQQGGNQNGGAQKQGGNQQGGNQNGGAAKAPPAAPVSGRETKVPITQFASAPFCTNSNMVQSDGTQIRDGSCSSTALGAIPSVDNMVSTIITTPKSGANVQAGQDNVIAVDMINLDTGFFADPQINYNKQPQTLNGGGKIEGHQHITIQKLDSTTAAPDATKFVFFKGLNDQSANGRTLSVTVPAGTFKANGLHRICSMSGTNAHQPPLMPVAQRGAQDDCIRVNVVGA